MSGDQVQELQSCKSLPRKSGCGRLCVVYHGETRVGWGP